MATATHNTLSPAIEGLKYTISRFSAFSAAGYSEYPLATWTQLETPLQDALLFLEDGNIQEALTSVSLLRSFDTSCFTLELQQCLKPFEYLEKGLHLLVSGDEENAFLALSDFWLTQQHFWHTNVFFLSFMSLKDRQRFLTSKRVLIRYGRTAITYFHVLLLALILTFIVSAVITDSRTWGGGIAVGALVSVFNLYVTSIRPTTAIVGRMRLLVIFFVEWAISSLVLAPVLALNSDSTFVNIGFSIGTGFAIAPLLLLFLLSPLGWGRYEKNLGQLDLFSCYWVRSLNAKECEVVVTDGSGKITQRHITKHSEDLLDPVSAGVIAEMCKPGYGAAGSLSKKETSVWYKYYPRISSLRYVKRRDKTSAKMFFRFFPGWFVIYRKWSPFVFTDDALLSTPGLTEKSLREYFASNPPCCEPAGYEEFVASTQ